MFSQLKNKLNQTKPRRSTHRREDSAQEEEKRRKREEDALVGANSVWPQPSGRKASSSRNDAENTGSHGHRESTDKRKHRSSREPSQPSVPSQPPQLPSINTQSHENSRKGQQTPYKSRLDPYSNKPLPRPSESTAQEAIAQSPALGSHETETFYESDDKDATKPPQVCYSNALMILNARWIDI